MMNHKTSTLNKPPICPTKPDHLYDSKSLQIDLPHIKNKAEIKSLSGEWI
jgi:hypothetical protein